MNKQLFIIPTFVKLFSWLVIFCSINNIFIKDSHATDRRFTHSYEVTTMPEGVLELETYFTWKKYDHKDRLDFLHELEYGITDKFQIALLSAWRHEEYDSDLIGSDTKYRYTALEVIYNLTDPNTSPLGSALYAEVGIGEEIIKVEGKLLLQKNIGPLALVYNLIVEAEWEGDSLSNLSEKKGEFANTLGASYQIHPSFLIGLEAIHEFELDDWEDKGDDSLYIGPSVSLRFGEFSIITSAVFEVLDVDGAADSQIRTIASIHF